MQENFSTKLSTREVTVIGLLSDKIPADLYKEIVVDSKVKAVVDWTMEIEARDYGVRSIILNVTEVSFDIEWSVSGFDLSSKDIEKLTDSSVGGSMYANDNIEGTASATVKNTDDNWKIIQNDFTVKSDFIQPEDVTINFETKTITISN